MKMTKLSRLAAAGTLCFLPLSAPGANETGENAGAPAEVAATDTNDTMSLSIVVAKGGG